MRANKITIGLMLFGMCVTAATFADTAELSKGEKDTVFIGRIQVQPAVISGAQQEGRSLELKTASESLETQFINSLNATRVFQIVERKRFRDIAEEQEFAKALADPNDKNTAKELMAAGAKFAFLPQIDGFDDKSETVVHQAIGRTSLTRKIFLSAVVQVVDTTTGKLLPDSPSVQVNKVEEVDLARGMPSGSQQALVELAKEMAGRLSQELVSLLRPAKILSVTGSQIQINRGIDAGFNIGDVVEIYAVQEVKDDDSGEVFLNEVPVGRATIIRNDKKQSFGKIAEANFGVAKGCVVKVLREENLVNSEETQEQGREGMTPGSSEKPLKW